MRTMDATYVDAYPRVGVMLIRRTLLLPPVVRAATLPAYLGHISSVQERARPVSQRKPQAG